MSTGLCGLATQSSATTPLAAFYQQFPVTPGEPDEVVRWLRALESLRQESPLKAGTRQDYYERIRYLYRWARDNVAGAQDLPELSYESFAAEPCGSGPAEVAEDKQPDATSNLTTLTCASS